MNNQDFFKTFFGNEGFDSEEARKQREMASQLFGTFLQGDKKENPLEMFSKFFNIDKVFTEGEKLFPTNELKDIILENVEEIRTNFKKIAEDLATTGQPCDGCDNTACAENGCEKGEIKFPNFNLFDMKSTEPFGAMNVEEDEKEYRITMLVPGISKEMIKVQALENTVMIDVVVETETTVTEPNYVGKQEFKVMNVSRKVNLPQGNVEKLKAGYQIGLLTIVVPKVKPKSKDTEPKSFDIK